MKFIIFIIIAVVIYLAVNTMRNNKRNLEMDISEFESMLNEEGISEELINSCLFIVNSLQKEELASDETVVSNNVIRRLSGWDYSKSLSEEYFKKIYLKCTSEIVLLNERAMEEYGFLPSDVGEGEHIKEWSKEAQLAEMALTQSISNVMKKYKNKDSE